MFAASVRVETVRKGEIGTVVVGERNLGRAAEDVGGNALALIVGQFGWVEDHTETLESTDRIDGSGSASAGERDIHPIRRGALRIG